MSAFRACCRAMWQVHSERLKIANSSALHWILMARWKGAKPCGIVPYLTVAMERRRVAAAACLNRVSFSP